MAAVQSPATSSSVFDRLLSIPFISDPLSYVNSTLANNAYTSSHYASAKGYSQAIVDRANGINAPKPISDLIKGADGYANKGLDGLEKRFPAAFNTHPQQVVDDVQKQTGEALEGVKAQGFSVGKRVDAAFTPLVNLYAYGAEKILASNPDKSSPEYQYQRVLNITLSLAHSSTSVLRSASARTTDAAYSTTNAAQSSAHSFATRVRAMSDAMINDVYEFQKSIADPESMPELNKTLSSIRQTLGDKQLNGQQKAHELSNKVSKQVGPVLNEVKGKIIEILKIGQKKTEETAAQAQDKAEDAQDQAQQKVEEIQQ